MRGETRSGLRDINSVPELFRMITHFTGERVTQLTEIRPGVWSVHLASGPYVVKIRRTSPRWLGEQKVLQSLGHVGVPTEQLLDIWPVDGDHALCRFSYVDGAPWSWDTAMTGAKTIGRLIGTLQQGLATVPDANDVPGGNLPDTLLHSIVPALVLTGRPMLMALQEQLLDVEDALWALQALPRQLIHRDVHTGNMLFRDSVFAGWVDFDLLETNFRIFDVCYCAAGLLAAQFTTVGWRHQWMSVIRTMVEAYDEVVRLVPAEVEAVWIAMIAIEALFVGINARQDPRAAEGTAAICRWLFEQRHRWPG